MADKKSQITYEILENYGELGSNRSGWTRELNLVKWNNNAPKLDLRDWNSDHTRMGKGITLSYEEVAILREVLSDLNLDEIFGE